MKGGSKLLYKELQNEFNFRCGWPTFSWVIALCSKFCRSNQFSGLFLAMLSHFWMKVRSKLLYEELQIKFDFRYGWPTFSWVTDLNLFGLVGDLYCFSNTHSMLVVSKEITHSVFYRDLIDKLQRVNSVMTRDHQEDNRSCAWSVCNLVQTVPEVLHSD